jgi:hypothetical protein
VRGLWPGGEPARVCSRLLLHEFAPGKEAALRSAMEIRGELLPLSRRRAATGG